MYYVEVRTLPESVLDYIRRQELLQAGDRLGVAVSGGADSVGLLRIMLVLRQELGIVLSVVHFNHKLRGGESDADEEFVARLAQHHQLEISRDQSDVATHAKTKRLSVEAAARRLRYQYFHRLMRENGLNHIATGHTLDDQAETVLLRVVRGAGTRGLAGIYSRLSVGGSQFSVIRPLLETRRMQLQSYLTKVGQEWREDASNLDLRYARNRVRHGILPRLERALNPRVQETLAETAEIARSEEEYWQKEVARALPQVWEQGTIRLRELTRLPLALQRRVVRAAAESLGLRLEFRHVEKILFGSAKSAALPNGWIVSRNRDGMRFELAEEDKAEGSDYEYVLTVPGRIRVPEAGVWLEAALVPSNAVPGYNRDHIFDPALIREELTVRNWRAGDRFWPAHSKSPKKIKELLQERKLTGVERKRWPVVVSGQEIVWVRGFAVPAGLRYRDGARQALVIQEHPRHE